MKMVMYRSLIKMCRSLKKLGALAPKWVTSLIRIYSKNLPKNHS